MKKIFNSFAVVTLIATASFFQLNTVKSTKLLAVDPPILTFPPPHITNINTSQETNLTVTVLMDITKTV